MMDGILGPIYCTSFVSSSFSYPPAHCLFLAEEGVVGAPADAAGGEEEPVHEDPGAVVVGVIGQEAVPLVALLAGAVSGAARGALLPAVTGLRTSQTNESVK